MSSPALVTFYSYKGGVGRTQALANVAVTLANQGRKVILLDMDLESPGLHHFFFPEQGSAQRWSDGDLHQREGLIDFLLKCSALPEDEPQVAPNLLACHHPALRPESGGWIRLLPAGSLDEEYPRRVTSFSWTQFYEEQDGYRYMELLRRQLFAVGADYVLLDSRTGMTDVGAIGTFQLPDIVVVLFALHRQGINGARRIADAIALRHQEPGAPSRVRRVLLVVSRVDEGDQDTLDTWMADARASLDSRGELLFSLDERLSYLTRYAFGEHIAVSPGGEENRLSRAYARLADRIVEVAEGRIAATGIPPEPARPGLVEIRASVQELRQELDTYLTATRRIDVPAMHVGELLRRAQDMVQTQRSLRERLRRLGQDVLELTTRVGIDPSALGGMDVVSPETPASLETLLAPCEKALPLIDAAIEHFLQEAREALIRSADGEDELVQESWTSVERLAHGGSLLEARKLVAAYEAELRRANLAALLRRNELEPARLNRRFPESEDHVRWLDDQIQQGVQTQEGPLEEVKASLWNLLRLRLSQPIQRPTRTHWAAYETVCFLVGMSDDAAEGPLAFKQVGRELWRLEWKALLAATTSDELEDPTGPETRQQLARFAENEPQLAIPIVEAILEDLRALWPSPDATSRLAALFRTRGNDPCLRLAIHEVDTRFPDMELTRRLLALWLQQNAGPAAEREVTISFLRNIVGEYPAEAFYALAALTRRDSALDEDRRLDCVYSAFALRLLEVGTPEQLNSFFSHFRGRVLRDRAGRVLVALLAGNLLSAGATFGVSLAQRFELLNAGREALPEPLRLWLSQPDDLVQIPGAALREFQSLIDRIQRIGETRFYNSWDASIHYEKDFQRLVHQELDALLDAADPDARGEHVHRLDSQRWINDFHREHRSRLKISVPTGTALKNIVTAFERLQESLLQLKELHSSLPTGPLRRSAEAARLREAASVSVRQWLQHELAEPGSDHQLLERLQAKLPEVAQ